MFTGRMDLRSRPWAVDRDQPAGAVWSSSSPRPRTAPIGLDGRWDYDGDAEPLKLLRLGPHPQRGGRPPRTARGLRGRGELRDAVSTRSIVGFMMLAATALGSACGGDDGGDSGGQQVGLQEVELKTAPIVSVDPCSLLTPHAPAWWGPRSSPPPVPPWVGPSVPTPPRRAPQARPPPVPSPSCASSHTTRRRPRRPSRRSPPRSRSRPSPAKRSSRSTSATAGSTGALRRARSGRPRDDEHLPRRGRGGGRRGRDGAATLRPRRDRARRRAPVRRDRVGPLLAGIPDGSADGVPADSSIIGINGIGGFAADRQLPLVGLFLDDDPPDVEPEPGAVQSAGASRPKPRSACRS